LGFVVWEVQGYLAHEKRPNPLGSPQVPRDRATARSQGGGGSYERGTPVELRVRGSWVGVQDSGLDFGGLG